MDDAESKFGSGQELLNATATKFEIKPDDLRAVVEEYKHCNCSHSPVSAVPMGTSKGVAPSFGEVVATKIVSQEMAKAETKSESGSAGDTKVVNDEGVFGKKVSKFAQDVVLHVVLHELAHGLVREFDLPILGNEETLADAFATVYLTTYLPDRAVDVLVARTRSLMIEAREVPRAEWTIAGEHNHDARRAYQIAALAIAADREKYLPVAQEVGMTANDIRNCSDYGTEIHRSWRRILKPLWMPAGTDSREVRFQYDSDGQIVSQLKASEMTREIEAAVKRFDWHSQVTIHFAESNGGAGWNRSRRTITVNSEYVQRFIKQGRTRK